MSIRRSGRGGGRRRGELDFWLLCSCKKQRSLPPVYEHTQRRQAGSTLPPPSSNQTKEGGENGQRTPTDIKQALKAR